MYAQNCSPGHAHPDTTIYTNTRSKVTNTAYRHLPLSKISPLLHTYPDLSPFANLHLTLYIRTLTWLARASPKRAQCISIHSLQSLHSPIDSIVIHVNPHLAILPRLIQICGHTYALTHRNDCIAHSNLLSLMHTHPSPS